jgi:hypothetical protein
MRRQIAIILAATLSTFVLACKNEQRVQAGREENQRGQTQTYQPLGGASTDTTTGAAAQNIQGELRSVNTSNMTFVVRTENGMEQTFRYDDDTSVSGIPSVGTTPSTDREKAQATQVRSLIGKEGSEVTVHWTQEGADKVATSIDVSQMATRPLGKKY